MRCRDAGSVRNSIAAICADYQANNRRLRFEHLQFSRLPALADAIQRAASGERPDGTRWIRCSHHTRKPRAVLDKATRRLLDSETAIAAVASFDDLHTLIAGATSDLKRLGPLYRYDVALRIGYKVGVAPDVVYLHAGTRAGAAALGLDVKRATISRDELPAPLRSRSAAEIEDILCIYKGQLAGLRG